MHCMKQLRESIQLNKGITMNMNDSRLWEIHTILTVMKKVDYLFNLLTHSNLMKVQESDELSINHVPTEQICVSEFRSNQTQTGPKSII